MTETPIQLPEMAPLNVHKVSETLKKKKIQPSSQAFGFIGMGAVGRGAVANMINSGHNLTLWNRSPEKCKVFESVGAKVAIVPSDVVQASAITFCCVADESAVNQVVFGNCGVLSEIESGKGFVEMSGIDHEMSMKIRDAVHEKGGRYLEVRFQGSREEAEEGTLDVMAAGDKSLYDDCLSCFTAIGVRSRYLGDVGAASKLHTVLQVMAGNSLAAVAEGLHHGESHGLDRNILLDLIKRSPLNSPLINQKIKAHLDRDYTVNQALGHLQKDINIAIYSKESENVPMLLTRQTNNMLRHMKKVGYKNYDVSAIFLAPK